MKVLITKVLLLLLMLSSACAHSQNNDKTNNASMKLIYVFDPLCGWCFGFEPVMEKVQEQYGEKIKMEVLSGGMVLPPNARPLSHMRSYLQSAIPRLEQMTGVKIGQAYHDNILNNDNLAPSSEMPSMVFTALKSKFVGKEVNLARKLQDLMFKQGLDTNLIDNYDAFLKELGITDIEATKKQITSEENKKATYQEFERSAQYGVQGYPALLLEMDGKLYQICSGYTDFDSLKKVLDQLN